MAGVELLNGLDKDLLHVGNDFVHAMNADIRNEHLQQIIERAIAE